MAVSKRLRFEILKRDGHTCQYCGAQAPDVPLHVDHIVPVALGGTNAPSNLVTACRDCNAGKGSSNASDAPVASPALTESQQRREAERSAATSKTRRTAKQEARSRFELWWPYSDMPEDWGRNVDKFIRMGLDPDDIEASIEQAVDRADGGATHVWLYFCKVCWAKLKEIGPDRPQQSSYEPVGVPYCIECDERPEVRNGLCRRCLFNLYEGIA